MYNKTNTKLIQLSFILLFVISTNALAAFNDSRVKKWEFFLAPQFTNSKLLQFTNGAEADINEHSSLGFGFAYNLNAHIELGGTFASSNSNYIGTRIIDNNPEDPENPNGAEKFTANMYTSSIDFNFTYNLLSSALTPYITANIGSTYIDSGVPTGDISTGCWWDPWWGYYVCGPVARTYTTTEINYGAGIGLRYDFNRKLYIKGGISKNYIDLNSTNTPDFTTYQFIFGFML